MGRCGCLWSTSLPIEMMRLTVTAVSALEYCFTHVPQEKKLNEQNEDIINEQMIVDPRSCGTRTNASKCVCEFNYSS